VFRGGYRALLVSAAQCLEVVIGCFRGGYRVFRGGY